MQAEGTFGILHLVYLVLSIVAFVLAFYFTRNAKKSEKVKTRVARVSGAILLFFILANRICVTYYDVEVNSRAGYTWLNLIPNTFCGLASLTLSLTLLLGKKDSVVLHCIAYLGILGGFVTMIYPDFLDSQDFFDIRSLTGLLHHTMMVWCVIEAIRNGWMAPTLRRFFCYPLGMCIVMTFGVFEMDCFDFKKAMQIGEPLLKSEPVLTSWYIVGLISVVLLFVFLVAYESKTRKVSVKSVLKSAFFGKS